MCCSPTYTVTHTHTHARTLNSKGKILFVDVWDASSPFRNMCKIVTAASFPRPLSLSPYIYYLLYVCVSVCVRVRARVCVCV